MEALDRGGRTFARRSLAHPSASPARAGRHAAASAGVDRVVCLLKAIAHPMRLRIAALLCDGELHVDAIARQLGVQPNTVSQQLRILRAVEIVVVRRGGGFAWYRVRDRAVRELVRSAHGIPRASSTPAGNWH